MFRDIGQRAGLLQRCSIELDTRSCHASVGWHPDLKRCALDASLRWHDNNRAHPCAPIDADIYAWPEEGIIPYLPEKKPTQDRQ
jgi:hypothetical protein